MFQRLKSKKGFTLIELIVVIAIIAILAAVLIPVIGNYTAVASENAALSDATEAKNMILAACADASAKGEMTGNASGGSVVLISNIGGTVSVTVDGLSKAAGATDDYKVVTILRGMLPGLKDGCKIKARVEQNAVTAYVYTNGKYVIQNGAKVSTAYDSTAI